VNDSHFTASSAKNGYHPYFARLHGTSCWIAMEEKSWLQVRKKKLSGDGGSEMSGL